MFEKQFGSHWPPLQYCDLPSDHHLLNVCSKRQAESSTSMSAPEREDQALVQIRVNGIIPYHPRIGGGFWKYFRIKR
jgi:hypothetical protein